MPLPAGGGAAPAQPSPVLAAVRALLRRVRTALAWIVLQAAARWSRSRHDPGAQCTDIVVRPRRTRWPWPGTRRPDGWHVPSRRRTARRAPQLPPDVLPLIAAFLDATTLARGACACKEWFFLCYADPQWRRLCVRDFRVDPSTVRGYAEKRIGARSLYLRLREQRRETVSMRVTALPVVPDLVLLS